MKSVYKSKSQMTSPRHSSSSILTSLDATAAKKGASNTSDTAELIVSVVVR